MKKIIYPEMQTAVSATSEAALWPDDNLLTDKVKQKWTANATNTATITLTVTAGVKALAIFGTNAVTVTIGALDPVILTENRYWYEYPSTQPAGDITIALTSAAGTTLEAGVIVAGGLKTLNNPSYDLSEELVDYSIITPMSGGSNHVRLRDIARQYTASMLVTRATQWEYLRDVFTAIGQAPAAMLVNDQENNQLYCGFFSMSPPRAAHMDHVYSKISLTLTEAI
jgi:hypothetical protein